MDITTTLKIPASLKSGCVVVGLYSSGKLASSGLALDKDCSGALSAIVKQGDITGKVGQALMLHSPTGVAVDRILLVGVGDPDSCSESQYRKIIHATMSELRKSAARNAVNTLTEINVDDRDQAWKCHQISLIGIDSGYVFDAPGKNSKGKNAADDKNESKLKKMQLLVTKSEQKEATRGSRAGSAVANGCAMARDLGNLPPNICTPDYLATLAKKMGRRAEKLKVSVLGEKQMEKLGMNALLSVSRGSRQQARLIVMEYKGAAATQKPVVLLGKGITFDTGGISIKPSASMDEMKFDMCGAASVFGVVESILELQPKQNITCVVAAAENMPDGDASRPGDVVSTMSSQTVEILNTDAEGRLVLCDALTYIERFKPAAVVDIATLTGACIVALGHVGSAMMSNDDELAEDLLQASRISGDKTWQLPLWEEYHSQLDSNFADLANIGGMPAGSITAGVFLSKFAEKYPWAHLDIAGVAWNSGKAKGATGRPVPLLMNYILGR